MDSKKEILIVPDVHGRDFWKSVLDYKDTPIIFLGDYVAPYTSHEGITNEQSIDMFKEILQFRKENPERVKLLLGNHDATYSIGKKVCNNRVDNKNYDSIRELFWNKENQFQLTHSITVNGRQFVFSHAGYTKKWILAAHELFMTEDLDKVLKDWDYLNRMNMRHADLLYRNLGMIHYAYRGGYDDCGSMIWADVREHVPDKEEQYEKETDITQVFSHSWCQKPIKGTYQYDWYMLDCKEVFYIDSEGIIRCLKDNKTIEEMGVIV